MNRTYYIDKLTKSLLNDKNSNVKMYNRGDNISLHISYDDNLSVSGITFHNIYLFKGIYQLSLSFESNSEGKINGLYRKNKREKLYNGINSFKFVITDHTFKDIYIFCENVNPSIKTRIERLKLVYLSSIPYLNNINGLESGKEYIRLNEKMATHYDKFEELYHLNNAEKYDGLAAPISTIDMSKDYSISSMIKILNVFLKKPYPIHINNRKTLVIDRIGLNIKGNITKDNFIKVLPYELSIDIINGRLKYGTIIYLSLSKPSHDICNLMLIARFVGINIFCNHDIYGISGKIINPYDINELTFIGRLCEGNIDNWLIDNSIMKNIPKFSSHGKYHVIKLKYPSSYYNQLYLLTRNSIKRLSLNTNTKCKYVFFEHDMEQTSNIIDNSIWLFNFDPVLLDFKLECELISFSKISDLRTFCMEENVTGIPQIDIYKKDHNGQMNVLAIMDEFSMECFSYDLCLTHITLDNVNTIDVDEYDFIIFESAWHGYKANWSSAMTKFGTDRKESKELERFIHRLNSKYRHIPKVFYNKEDPFNFNLFRNFAGTFNKSNDVVVTTDFACIDKYKELGCKNVIAFPFCCQPIIHNPVNREYNNKCVFPCSWYGYKYPERCLEMKNILDRFPEVHIFDRQYLFDEATIGIDDNEVKRFINWYSFPKKYSKKVMGQLNYKQVLHIYKKYGIVLNVNTVTDSKTMFARRVTEATACGCGVKSNQSDGIDFIYGDLIYNYNNKKKIPEETKYEAHKLSMIKYTYINLINSMMKEIKLPQLKSLHDEKALILLIGDKESASRIYEQYKIKVLHKNLYDNITSTTITKIVNKYRFLYIMHSDMTYSNDYICTSIIPFKFTDAKIVGKSCYVHLHQIVNEGMENRFTRYLHPFTLCIDLDKCKESLVNNIERGEINIFNWIQSQLKIYDNNDYYSYYRYEFKDNGKFLLSKIGDFDAFKGIKITTPTILVMCNWKRTHNMARIIRMLNRQTDMNFTFCIWNNNEIDARSINRYMKDIPHKFKSYIYHNRSNIGGVGRFLMTRKMIQAKVNKNANIKNVIFFDDDQIIPTDFVEKMTDQYNKYSTIYSNVETPISINWSGRRFIKGKSYVPINDDGSLDGKNAKYHIHKIEPFEIYDYGGTGGMCIDVDIFLYDDIFCNIPIQFMYCEDLLLSYILNYKYGYKFIKSDVGLEIEKDGEDQSNGLWKVKNDALEYCRKHGWNV